MGLHFSVGGTGDSRPPGRTEMYELLHSLFPG
jgi:hypothetical protein